MQLQESETTDVVQIPKLKCLAVEKRLGVWSSCNGTWTKEFNNWISYSKGFGQKVRGTGLGRMMGYLSYHSMWLTKFRCSASVIGFSISQLKTIQKSATGACIQHQSTTITCQKQWCTVLYYLEVVMDWDNISIVFLYEKLKLPIASIRLQDTVGKMLLVQISRLQLFSGISFLLYLYLIFINRLDYQNPPTSGIS